jgi:Family of unknown function (DUF6461)
MDQDIVSRYLWVREHGIHVASCISLVRGVSEDDALRRFGGDPATTRLMTLTEVADESCNNEYPYGYAPLLLVDTINDWVVIFEDNGVQGVRHEVLQAVSRGAEMVSVFWNVNALQRFVYAVDGRTVTEFELLCPESRRGAEPDRLLAYMRDLPFEIGNTLASAMALSERITGVRIDRSWFENKRRVVEVTPLPQEPYPNLKPEETSLALYHPEIATLIRDAQAPVWRGIALLAAERSAAETGIASDQAISAALQALRSGISDLDASRASLTPVLQTLERAMLTAPKPTILQSVGGGRSLFIDAGQERRLEASRRVRAGYAARNALLPDPLMSALHSVYEASLAVSDKEGFFQEVIAVIHQGYSE